MTEIRDAEIHHLIGGELCMDFANTLYGHTAPIHEYLFNYRDLVLWCRHAGVLTDKEVRGLMRESKRCPADAEAVFHQAISIRETIYQIFVELTRARSFKDDNWAMLQSAWLDAMTHRRLLESPIGFSQSWEDGYALDRMLWPIIDSAVKLLTSEEIQRVKQCNGCDWLFVDKSRNHLRRWCSMDKCGNRAKMRRRHALHKMKKR